MKTAVIYYSYDGNCALVAEYIKNILNADLFEIKISSGKKRKGFANFFQGLLLMIKKPEILPLSVDINAYEQLILGAPVWGGSPASPLVSFLNKTNISGKKIALFCCHGGSTGKTFDKLKALLSGNTIIGEIGFKSPARERNLNLKEEITAWLNGLK